MDRTFEEKKNIYISLNWYTLTWDKDSSKVEALNCDDKIWGEFIYLLLLLLF